MSKAQARKDFQDEFRYHQREWRVERIGWLVMLAFVVAAVAGVFGHGPISERTIGDSRTATLEYERFLRYAAGTQLGITVAAGRRGPIAVEVNRSYLSDFEITSIVPEPRSATLLGDRYRFEFDLEAAPARIVFHITPERIGGKHAAVTAAGTQLELSQFVYP